MTKNKDINLVVMPSKLAQQEFPYIVFASVNSQECNPFKMIWHAGKPKQKFITLKAHFFIVYT